MFFSLYSTRKNEANFTNLGSGTAQVLPKGGDAWSEVTASEGILTLPAGFEGYILAPLTEMRQDSVAGRTDNRYAISVSFRFLALGGAAGSTTLDGLYLLSGMGNDPAADPERLRCAGFIDRRTDFRSAKADHAAGFFLL